MRRDITLLDADGDEVQVTFKSTAATPYQYKAAFGSDLYADLRRLEADEVSVDVVYRLAYCMACTGAGRKADPDGLLPWLETLDPGALMGAAGDIVAVYYAGAETHSRPKNPGAPSPGK